MASLHGLPPLPKSLSALLNFSSSQWKEFERLHTMRTMIQQDLNKGAATFQRALQEEEKQMEARSSGRGSPAFDNRSSPRSRLDAQLALLRKEMVGLRQLDMSLLCQLWSLNESIQEYKHLLHKSMSYASSPGWENGMETLGDEDPIEVRVSQRMFELQRPIPRHKELLRHRDLSSVPESMSSDSSSSQSSFEFGDI